MAKPGEHELAFYDVVRSDLMYPQPIQSQPIRVVWYESAALQGTAGRGTSDHLAPPYSQLALQLASYLGDVNEYALPYQAAGREDLAIRLAAKVANEAGVFVLASSGVRASHMALAYGIAATLNPPLGQAMHFRDLEAVGGDLAPYPSRRAVAAVMKAATQALPEDTQVIVDGHREIPETRGTSFFTGLGMHLERAPQWGRGRSRMVGTLAHMRPNLEAYVLQPLPDPRADT